MDRLVLWQNKTRQQDRATRRKADSGRREKAPELYFLGLSHSVSTCCTPHPIGNVNFANFFYVIRVKREYQFFFVVK